MTNLSKNCVTMNELIDKFYENTKPSDITCEKCPKLSGKSIRNNFEKNQSVLKPTINLMIFIQRPQNNFERYEYLQK